MPALLKPGLSSPQDSVADVALAVQPRGEERAVPEHWLTINAMCGISCIWPLKSKDE